MFGKSHGRKFAYRITPGRPAGFKFGGGGFGPRGFDFLKDLFYTIKNRISEFYTIIAIVGGALIIGFIIMLGVDFYHVRQLADFQPNVTTQIYDKNGELVSELFWQKREVVPFDKIPKDLVHAIVSMEDNDFYDHWGVNPKGIIRAFFVNILSGRVKQGGSTITQQTAKILLTSQKRNIFRKVKEACIAVMLEVSYPKNKILELYFNQIFLGHGCYGVETASKIYFDKHVWELNTAECALLATLPSAPNLLSPIKYPERSMRAHRIALAKMVDQGFLKTKDAEDAYLKFWPDYLKYINDIPPTMTATSERIDKAPWFTEYIRRKLVEKYGEDMVFNKGLLVYTTLDLKKQLAAEKVVKPALKRQTAVSNELSFKNEDFVTETMTPVVEMLTLLVDIDPYAGKTTLLEKKTNDYFQDNVLDSIEGLNYIVGCSPVGGLMDDYRRKFQQDKEFQDVEGALITINHKNGFIEAMIGGSNFSSINQLNRAIQARRQTGSSIKPLLYAAAFDVKKFTPATAVLDSPIVFLDNEGGEWTPENYEGGYEGLVRLRVALAKSINSVSIRIAEKIGIQTVIDYYAKFLHFNDNEKKARLPRNLSIALGSLEVSPYELARAYGIIARGGTDFIPYAIRQVKDIRGNVLDDPEKDVLKQMAAMKSKGYGQIIKPETSQVMISILQTVVSSGTGGAASIGRPVGGKTGTTNSWRDAWFVGFTPEVTTCLWLGYDKLGMSLGSGQTGGGVAAPIWGEYMRLALAGDPVTDFPVYGGLQSAEVCERSGMKPSDACRTIIKEVFVPGTVPEEECTLCQQGDGALPEELKRRGPKDDLVNKQRAQILQNIRNKKDSSSVIDNVGGDLLDK
jgi:penicillin-binding protein 1A